MKISKEEVNLEDLIILGEDTHVPITIDYPTENNRIKAKALIKPLTLKELKNVKVKENDNLMEMATLVLSKGLLKQDGTPMPFEIIENIPYGVINQIAELILEISGMDMDEKVLKDF